MSDAFGPGDRVRVLRNIVGAYKINDEKLSAGDIITVHHLRLNSIEYYFYYSDSTTKKLFRLRNSIPREDVELVEKFSAKPGDRVRVVANEVNAHGTNGKLLAPGDVITIDSLNGSDIYYKYPSELSNGQTILKVNTIPIGDVELLKEEQVSSSGHEPECHCDNKYILHGMHEKGCAYKTWRDTNRN